MNCDPRVRLLHPSSHWLLCPCDTGGAGCESCPRSQWASGGRSRFMTLSLEHSDFPAVLTKRSQNQSWMKADAPPRLPSPPSIPSSSTDPQGPTRMASALSLWGWPLSNPSSSSSLGIAREPVLKERSLHGRLRRDLDHTLTYGNGRRDAIPTASQAITGIPNKPRSS